jgi:uncharacterized sulfatase
MPDSTTPSSSPLQVVLLMSDTHRWDLLGCVGTPGIRTPSLDRLAAQGLRFDRAYTTCPVCGPARSALFTGLYPHSNGEWTNSVAPAANVKTIGQRLSDRGIHCAYVGKWHLDGTDYFGDGRCPPGWDERYWYDMRRYLEEHTDADRVRSRQYDASDDPTLASDFTYAHRCSDRAIDFIEKHRGQSFFLVVSYDEPHGPFVAPAEFSRSYADFTLPRPANLDDDLADKPEHHRVWSAEGARDRWKAGVRHPRYFGSLTHMDQQLGRVLEAIDRCTPDALVLYTSDHGDLLGSHGLTGKGPAVYDEIARIPLIVRWPGRTPAGVLCPHPVSHIDLVPTILDVFGVAASKWMDGESLKTTLLDPRPRPRDAVFIEFGRYEIDHDGFGGFQPLRAIFDGRHKLAINLLSGDELYDLQADPQEMRNLISSPGHAEIRDRLHDRLLDWMNQTRDPFRGYYWRRRPWRSDAPPATWADTGYTRQREHEEYEPRQLDYDTGLPMQQAVRPKH